MTKFKLFVIGQNFEKEINKFTEFNKIIKWEKLGRNFLGERILLVEHEEKDD